MAKIDYSSGIVTSPVSLRAVSSLVGAGTNDLGALCKSDKVNMYSKHKPYGVSGFESPWLYDTGLAWLESNQWGVSFNTITADSSWNITEEQIKTRIAWSHGCIPEGGVQSPYRLGDFRGYNNNAKCPINAGGNFGKSIQVEGTRMTIKNISINSVDSNSVVTLKDISISSYGALSTWYLGLAFYHYSNTSEIGELAYIVTDYNAIGTDDMEGQSRTYNISALTEDAYMMFVILSPSRYATIDDDGYPIGSTSKPTHRVIIPEDGFRYVLVDHSQTLVGEIIFSSSVNEWYHITSRSSAAVVNDDEGAYSYVQFGTNGTMRIEKNDSAWDSQLDTTYMQRRLTISPASTGEGFFGYIPPCDTDACPYVDDEYKGRTPGIDKYIHIVSWEDIDHDDVSLCLYWKNIGYQYIDEDNLVVYYRRYFALGESTMYAIDSADVYIYYTYDSAAGWTVNECSAVKLTEINIAREVNSIAYLMVGDTEFRTIQNSTIYFATDSALVLGGQIETPFATVQFPAGNVKYLYTVNGQAS